MSNTQNIEEDINFDDLNENTQNEIKSNKSKPTKPVKKKKGLMAVLVPSSGRKEQMMDRYCLRLHKKQYLMSMFIKTELLSQCPAILQKVTN
jgi:hypothetical protein